MTQRIFDIENEKDMQDLWNILPDFITSVYQKKESVTSISNWVQRDDGVAYPLNFISLRWHDATEITRPVDCHKMVGCVGWFWDDSKADDTSPCLGVLTAIAGGEYYTQVETWGFDNFRPAKKSELKFWGE